MNDKIDYDFFYFNVTIFYSLSLVKHKDSVIANSVNYIMIFVLFTVGWKSGGAMLEGNLKSGTKV